MCLFTNYGATDPSKGELVYVREMNILIVNTSRVANDLLEKRARIFSDRRVTPMMEL